MRVRKLLYIADRKKRGLSPQTMENLLAFRKGGVEEIVFLNAETPESRIEELSRLSVKSKVLSDVDVSPDVITRITKDENISLIVIGLEKEGEDTHINAVLKDLIEITTIPLLIVKENGNNKISERGLFDHIIFATDWSASSEKALQYLLGFKELMSALDIVHVFNRKLTVKDMRDLRDRLVETRKICLDEGIDAESHVYAGKTGEEIVRASQDYRGTVIVLGASTRKSFWKELFDKNATYGVIREASIPVCVVPSNSPANE
jgi:nucleotide-binding universal stress UspA family protein